MQLGNLEFVNALDVEHKKIVSMLDAIRKRDVYIAAGQSSHGAGWNYTYQIVNTADRTILLNMLKARIKEIKEEMIERGVKL